jgi:hypothetical protein
MVCQSDHLRSDTTGWLEQSLDQTEGGVGESLTKIPNDNVEVIICDISTTKPTTNSSILKENAASQARSKEKALRRSFSAPITIMPVCPRTMVK